MCKRGLPPRETGRRNTDAPCIVRLDRVQFIAWPSGSRLPNIRDFQNLGDHFVRSQTSIATYRRVRRLLNTRTGTQLWLQYWPAAPWLAPIKGTIVAEDKTGLQREELEMVASEFRTIRLLLVELAIDFGWASGVDDWYVRRHGLFGKSRPGGAHKSMRYGTRKSAKMVRCYAKPEVQAYRVELELHSGWLYSRGISQPGDLACLPPLLIPAHVRFVQLDHPSLKKHLKRAGLPVKDTLRLVRAHGASIHNALAWLRNGVGLQNVHRLLRSTSTTLVVRRAVREWAEKWRQAGGRTR